MKIIGIDPGKSGAVAMIDGGKVLFAVDTPIITSGKGKSQYDERAMFKLLEGAILGGATLAVLEKVSAMPGQGVTSMFSFGQGFGMWLGMLAALPIPYALVTPQRWKATMLADIPGDDQKARSVIAAKRMFPGLEFARKKDHGRAEAILLASWGFMTKAIREG